eukprot:5008684-Pleurochrysis_carterae.AAC.1
MSKTIHKQDALSSKLKQATFNAVKSLRSLQVVSNGQALSYVRVWSTSMDHNDHKKAEKQKENVEDRAIETRKTKENKD